MKLDYRTFAWLTVCVALAGISLPMSAHAEPTRSDEIEGGATHPSSVEIHAGHRVHDRDYDYDHHPRHDVRIGLQARLDAFNSLNFSVPDPDTTAVGRHLLVPMVAPGVRLLDERLFLGLGLGLTGGSTDNGMTTISRSGFSLTPMAHYDVIEDGPISFSLGGWMNLAHLGETETCTNTCVTANNDSTGWGLSLAAGVHAWLVPGLSLGGEFGWGFLSISTDPGTDTFVHSLFGTIVLEATFGL